MNAQPFISSSGPALDLPLSRYLPPIPPGMITAWLEEKIKHGSWLIDPLTANPLIALEAASAGYRVLATSNNPILALLLEVLASSPTTEEFNTALTKLADAKRGDERLEVHLQSLYLSPCPGCERMIPASAYLWKKDESTPIARYIKCRECHKEGEFPITPEDLNRFPIPGSRHLLQSRAFERVGLSIQQPSEAVKEAVDVYLERSLYVLFTIINKIEGLSIPTEQKKLLYALAISGCDEGNSLWPHSGGKIRPRLITLPGEFWEKNLWMALEDAITSWTEWTVRIPLTRWPEIIQEGNGITLYPGRFKTITDFPQGLIPRAIVSAIPYPNQAFWTFSAIWSGWLWGRQAVAPLRMALERQRYDSHWLASALTSAFGALPAVLPFFALVPELSTSFLQAVTLAGQAVGLKMNSLAIGSTRNFAQILWDTGFRSKLPMPTNLSHFCRDAIQADLENRGEPTSYLQLTATSLAHLFDLEIFPSGSPGVASEMLNKVQSAMKDVMDNRSFLVNYGSKDPDSQGSWWLKEVTSAGPSLSDRIELLIQEILRSEITIQKLKLEKILNSHFPGLMTPSLALMDACLESYAEPLQEDPDTWKLRNQETSQARGKDLQDARDRIQKIGMLLGYQVIDDGRMFWKEKERNGFGFIIFDTCAFTDQLDVFREDEKIVRVVVFPGSRAGLLIHKMQKNPYLEEKLKTWHLLKLRYLRQLAERSPMTEPMFLTLLDGDPLLWEKAEQMPIFNNKG